MEEKIAIESPHFVTPLDSIVQTLIEKTTIKPTVYPLPKFGMEELDVQEELH